jgi:hypothetical protein
MADSQSITGQDLTGQRFGRLTVVEPSAPVKGHRIWLTLCECGITKHIRASHLTTGKVRSCGCLALEHAGNLRRTHGKSRTPEHIVWKGIKQRCENPKVSSYAHYGGRGIRVCDEWRDSFENFLRDMGEKPSADHSLERLDNDGPYSPSNCCWATRIEQANNKRSNINLRLGEEVMSISEWSRKLGIPDGTIRKRIRLGWDHGRILTAPSRKWKSRKAEVVTDGG